MKKKLNPIPPGDILLHEFMAPLGITQSKLAKDIHVEPNRVSQIIHNKRDISPDTAIRLATYFNTSVRFWLNLQTIYQLDLLQEKRTKIEKEINPCGLLAA